MRKSRERLVIEALDRIFGRTVKVIVSDGVIIKWDEPSEAEPTADQIQAVINQMKAEEPMKLLRKERDILLSQCDWRLAPDYPHSDQPAWIEYRQKLRDIPGQVESGVFPYPTMNEDGELIFENFPQPPN